MTARPRAPHDSNGVRASATGVGTAAGMDDDTTARENTRAKMNNYERLASLRRPVAIVALLLFAALWFGNLDYRKLVRPDEGRYAEIARDMAATGDWITPRLNGIKYFEKPPLQYWATAAAFRTFGEHEWTVRLWPALTGFLGVLLVGVVGASVFGPAAGLYSTVVLAGSAGYMLMAHMATLDMGFTLFMTLAMAGFVMGLSPATNERRRATWLYTAWLGMALAVLSKGLAGIVLPLLVVALYALVHRDFGIVRQIRPMTGSLLFLAVASPWFIAVSLANPEFPSFFFIHEHFARFLTQVHRRDAPWWYFLPMLVIGILPWLMALPHAIAAGARRDARSTFHAGRFLVIWAVAIFLFFSASHSKLPSYILPIFPALALLIAAQLARSASIALRWTATLNAVIGLSLLLAAPAVVKLARNAEDALLFEAYVPWLRGAGAMVVAGAALAWLWAARRRTAAIIAMGVAALLAEQAISMGHNALAPRSSSHALAQKIRPHFRADTPFYSVGTYDPTLPFYLKRTPMLVAFDGEMAYGLEQEPQLWIHDLDAFKPVWNNENYAVAVMPPQVYAYLLRQGLRMKEIARDNRLVAAVTDGGAR